MRVWLNTALVVIAACGGSSGTNIDGGTDASFQPDTGMTNDSGNQDVSTSDVNMGSDSASETGAEAGPFDPSQLNGLALWLDAAKGVTVVGGFVTAWADQTTNMNNAAAGAHGPTLQAMAVNNLPAVDFAGGAYNTQTLTINDSASLEFGTTDFAIFMVAEYQNVTATNGASVGTLYDKVAGNTTPTGVSLYGNQATGDFMFASNILARLTATDTIASAATGFNNGAFHRIGIRRTGNTLQVWADGVSTSFTPDAGSLPDVSAVGTNITIGDITGGGGTFDDTALKGGIAEVIGVNTTISDADVTNLDGYFTTKYAL
jgi:hypothetical protein